MNLCPNKKITKLKKLEDEVKEKKKRYKVLLRQSLFVSRWWIPKDTGIGIPEIEQSKIFSPFYRASNAFTAKPDASGVGLYIAKHVVEQLGGKIGFQSQDGVGSEFWFELPTDESFIA